MTDTPDAVVLLFSGGLDTTLEVVELLEDWPVVHLVTFDNGLCVNRGGARRRAAELAARAEPGRLVHAEVDTRELMQTLRERARHAPRELRSPLSVDMACKMASLAHVVLYARQHDVPCFTDGSAREQTQVFMQHPEFGAHVKPFLERYGVRFLPPRRFDWSRDQKIRRLEELGLASGPRALEHLRITSQLAHQPFCTRGFVTFLFTSPTRHFPPFRQLGLPMDRAKELWDFLLPDAEAWLDRALER